MLFCEDLLIYAYFHFIVRVGRALLDLLAKDTETCPQPKQKVLCRHPIEEAKRVYVIPGRVESLLKLYWKDGQVNFFSFESIF